MTSREEKRKQRDEQRRRKKPKRPRVPFSEDDLQHALILWDSREDSGTSEREIEKMTGVPRSTLRRHSHLKGSLRPLGRPNLIPEEVEKQMAETLFRFCKKGDAMPEIEFEIFAVEFVKQLKADGFAGLPDKFAASKNWKRRFYHDHNIKRWKRSRSRYLGIHRRLAAQEDTVQSWIQLLGDTMIKYKRSLAAALNVTVDLLSPADAAKGIIAVDETHISNAAAVCYEPTRCVDSRVSTMDLVVGTGSTIQAACCDLYSADGQRLFNILITVNKLASDTRRLIEELDQNTYFSSIGKYNSNLHATVIERVGVLRQKLPTLLIQDAPRYHTSDVVIQAAKQNNIFLLCLPHNSSWFLQVADHLPFMLVKNAHYRSIVKYRQREKRPPDLRDSLFMFYKARAKCLTTELITRAFAEVGQWPFSPAAINKRAESARLRCSGATSWTAVEGVDTTADWQLEEIKDVVQQLSLLKDRLKNMQQRQESNRSDPQLIETLQSVELASQRANQQWLSEKQAAEGRASESIRQQARRETEEDDIVWIDADHFNPESWLPTELSLRELKTKKKQARNQLKRLKTKLREERNATNGALLVEPGQLDISDIIRSRKEVYSKLKVRVKEIQEDLHRQAALRAADEKYCCLEDLCSTRMRGSHSWQLCTKCNRGFCSKHQRDGKMALHEQRCEPSERGSDSESSTTEDDFCPPEDHSQSMPSSQDGGLHYEDSE